MFDRYLKLSRNELLGHSFIHSFIHPSIHPSIHGATAPSGPWPTLRRRLPSSLSSARLLHPRIPRICDVPPDDVLPFCSWFSHWSNIMKFPIKNLLGHGIMELYGKLIIIRRSVDGPNTNHRRKLSLFEDSSLLSRYTVSKQVVTTC